MRARNCVTWITSLSLDASTVALVWQHSISVQHSLSISWHHRVLVFSAVWLGYSADRWFDAWRHEKNVSQRHSFHAVRRWTLLGFWIFVLGVSISIAVIHLHPHELRNGLYLAFTSIAIMAIFQWARFRHFQMIAKSALTAFLVAASVLIFSMPPSTRSTIEAIIVMASLFYFNCILIHSWDRFIDALQEPRTKLNSPKIAIAIATIAALTISIPLIRANPLALFSVISIALLLLIHGSRKQLHEETRRTLADLALLTPVLALI